MDEELNTLIGLVPIGDSVAGVGDEVRTRLEGDALGVKPAAEQFRPGEDPNTVPFTEAMTSLLANHADTIFETVFNDRRCRQLP